MPKQIKLSILLIALLTISLYFFQNYISRPTTSLDFPNTLIAPTLDAVIDKNKNLIYCSAFQMAWNETTKIIDETIEIDNAPEYVSKLNDLINQPSPISKDFYLACAGFKKDNIIKNINLNFKKKLFKPMYNSEKLINDNDLLIYSNFNKMLTFKNKFENINEPLIFRYGTTETKISAFGIKKYEYFSGYATHDLMAEQVEILYWSHKHFMPEGCIIKLKSLFINEDIIISTIDMEDTLLKTYKKITDFIDYKFDDYCAEFKAQRSQEIMQRLYSTYFIINVNVKFCKSLIIPKININFIHSFIDLMNKNIKNQKFINKIGLSTTQPCRIADAIQEINFKINDECTQPESTTNFGSIASGITPKPLCINGPFVIFIKKRSSELPYFMAYIANDELLVKYPKENY